MKKRKAFVSNSSSSCFIIQKRGLTLEQADAIRNHIDYAAEHFPIWFDTEFDDWWRVEEHKDAFVVSTWMDNFDMRAFLDKIGIDPENIS